VTQYKHSGQVQSSVVGLKRNIVSVYNIGKPGV
jgi:hypothetical protein